MSNSLKRKVANLVQNLKGRPDSATRCDIGFNKKAPRLLAWAPSGWGAVEGGAYLKRSKLFLRISQSFNPPTLAR